MSKKVGIQFSRVAIVNRGEPAMRLIRAVRDWNASGKSKLSTVALYTDPDADALFVREADTAYCLGTAMFDDVQDLDEQGRPRKKSRYLDYNGLRAALQATGADAAWVGWGFVAEHAAFADLCTELGIVFIGPSAESMRRLGDKIASKLLAESAGVPVAPWSGGPIATIDEALRAAGRIGYPLLVKASAGGGGRGIRIVANNEELAEAVESSMGEARKAFGDATVFLESCVTGARHIEVQVVADAKGTIWPLGIRDCTAQRSRQKVIEEAPSVVLSAKVDTALRQAAVSLAQAAKYRNAGTVEFLFSPASGAVYFMEMNTRLQVEHPVTEVTTGTDLVSLQLAIARGETLSKTVPPTVGHAIEVRICAEDPDRGFAPAPGRVVRFRPPLGAGVRTDSGVREGDTIPLEFDSMIAKIIAHGATRGEALARLRRALDETQVVIEGGTTNRTFLARLLAHPDFVASNFDTQWIDKLMQAGGIAPGTYAHIALLSVSIHLHEQQLSEQALNFFVAASRGRPSMPAAERRPIELRYGGATYEFRVAKLDANSYRVEVDGGSLDLRYETDGEYDAWLSYETAEGRRRFRIVCTTSGGDFLVEVDSNCYRISGDPGGVVRAPAPGLVLTLQVAEGDRVARGQRLLSLEAMKMEMPLLAPVSGRVRKLMVGKSMQVGAGDPLLVLEPEGTEAAEVVAVERLSFPHRVSNGDEFAGVLADLRRLLLGFSVGGVPLDDLPARFATAAPATESGSRARAQAAYELLRVYLDLEEPFSRSYGESSGSLKLSNEECLHLYLREFHAEGSGLPADFLAILLRALAYYGVTSLVDSPRLRDALSWLYRSHQNVTQKNHMAVSILERCLEDAEWRASASSPEFANLLQRMVRLTRWQHPRVNEAAEQARYALFTGRALEERRRVALARVETVLATVNEGCDHEQQAEAIAELARIPYALTAYLAPMIVAAGVAGRAPILEVLARHFYRTRRLVNACTLQVAEQPQVLVSFDDSGKHSALVGYTSWSQLAAVFDGLLETMRQMAAGSKLEVDLLVNMDLDGVGDDPQALLERLAPLPCQGPLTRVTLVPVRGAAVQTYTFVPGERAWREDEVMRGLHPAVAERLELWRLTGFKLQRLATPLPDLYLFHAHARENERDERLFAIAEIREMHVIRDRAGNLVSAPEVEHIILASFQAIREQQARRDARHRLHWNRVSVFLQPTLLARREELLSMAERLHVSAEGLGLEKVVLRLNWHEDQKQVPHDTVVSFSNPTGHRVDMIISEPHREPLRVLDDYSLRVVRARQRRLTYAYEIVKMLAASEATGELPAGEFQEHDLGQDGDANRLVSVAGRPYGKNAANVVVGIVRSFTSKHPEGMARVLVVGDGTQEMGALGEPECKRIIAALDLAQHLGVPLEWFPVSSGAKIAMDSGTENLDWTAAVLRRIIELTQGGGEINIVVDGINVGAQSYWNAEATMLMHTRGCLIMTPRGSMLLTGKRALDYSGGVSAEDNLGIGGFERIMGPNGQAQYHATDLRDACRVLMRYYEHTYVTPGEKHPRRRSSTDDVTRDVTREKYTGPEQFALVGDIWSDEHNSGRHKPFDIRAIMRAVTDVDAAPLERWPAQRDGEMAVIWDTHLGGWPVCLIGIESKSLPRLGWAPADGPTTWSGGTLFPTASKKVARAINSASGNRPVVVLANLSGFDGSPESLRLLQLEYGAEIGRAVVNCRGPLIFCVIARYHGGAYVVFSKQLNPHLKSLAVDGSFASVIGGAAAAAVVFPDEARSLARKDPRIVELDARLKAGGDVKVRREHREVMARVLAEKTHEVAQQFDRIHSVQRAMKVGSLDGIIAPSAIRSAIIKAIESDLHEPAFGVARRHDVAVSD